MRVIDAHAHIFPGAAGRQQGRPVSSGKYGKVFIGDESRRMLPPCFEDSACGPELLTEIMDAAGVEGAVLLQNPTFGIVNEYISGAIKKYPGRFRGTIQVDPFDEGACAQVGKYASPEQNSLKLELSQGWGWSGDYPDLSLADGRFVKLWDTAAKAGLRIIIDPGPISENGYQVENIASLAGAYPGTMILIEHLGYMTAGGMDDITAKGRWREMLALGRDHGNVFFGTSAVGTLMGEPYPCRLSQQLLEEAVGIVGTDKLLWGSDLPTTFKDYTYRQMISFIADECGFLSGADREKLLGRNAQIFFDF